jgi:exodeoxyribonuclease-3
MPLKLATFNINNIAKRPAVLLEWLTKASHDIVCLQEINVLHVRFPLRQIEAAGYSARSVGQPSWNGVAILARGITPVETRRQMSLDAAGIKRRSDLQRALSGQGAGHWKNQRVGRYKGGGHHGDCIREIAVR